MKEIIIEIENAKTKKVKEIKLPLLEYIEDKYLKVDLSSLSKEEIEIIELAISKDPSTSYTDIEMFFVGDECPNFGPDYDFNIVDNTLIGNYIKIKNIL